MRVNRRAFIKSTAVAAAGVSFRSIPLLAQTSTAAGDGKNILVFVFLRGGVDGLALVPPHADGEYYRLRPTIALPRPNKEGKQSVLDLDGYFGLHPALGAMKPLYDDKRLAIVQAVGCYALSRSHFDAQEFVETGTPGRKGTPKGFLTRAGDSVQGGALTKAISFSRLRPRALQGPDAVLVSRDLQRFDFAAPGWRDEAEQLLRSMYALTPGPVGQVGRDTLEIMSLIKRTPALGAKPAHGAVYPDAFVGKAFQQAAQVVKAGIGTRCIFIDLDGNFDTHSNQIPLNQSEFEPIAQALAAFYTDLGASSDRVAVIVATEFGRALEENGAKGTDHGSGGAVFVIGDRVRGGKVAGAWPGIGKGALYEGRDVAVTTDFRDLFAEVVRHHLGIGDTSSLFPQYDARAELGLFA